MHLEQVRQDVDHIVTRDASLNLQRQAFPRVFVQHWHELQLPSVLCSVEHEVVAPHMVSVLGATLRAAILA
jgi:hypothetical protein